MRAAIYLRVSTEEQGTDDKVSLAYQKQRCRAYCESHGWEVVELYTQTTSGRKWARLQPMLDAARLKAFDVVVFMKIDRFARNLRDLVNMEHELQELGVGIASVQENFDTSTLQGKAMFQMMGTFAELEVGTITERMQTGIRERVRSGKMYKATTPPYGYRYNVETKQIEVREDTAQVVKRIYQLYLSGKGTSAIASILEEAGVPTPAKTTTTKRVNKYGWAKSRVRAILKAPRYRGESSYAGIPMLCPRIIDDATWFRVQELMGTRSTDYDSRRTSPRTYMLAGRLFCGTCGGTMTTSSSSSGHTAYYKCRRRAYYSKKRSVVKAHEGLRWEWPINKVDQVVQGVIDWWMSDPGRLAPHVERRAEFEQRRVEGSLDEVRALQAQLKDIEAQEDRVLELARKGVYEGDQLDKELKAVRDERNRVKPELRAAQKRAGVAQDTVSKLLEFRQHVLELALAHEVGVQGELKWEPPKTVEEWQQLVRYICDRVIITAHDKNTYDVRCEGVINFPTQDEAASFVRETSSPR
jgi:site-specific DNA recombinase